MKSLSGFTIICLCLLLPVLTGIVAADSPQYDKYVSLHMNIDNGNFTTNSTGIYYGSASNLFPAQPGFRAELVAANGSIVKTFTVWDPRVQYGDFRSSDGQILGVVDRRNSTDFVVTFPFDRNVTGFMLYNPAGGALLASVDLKPQIDSFFADYPNDPDNPASFESKAPVNVNPPRASLPGSDASMYGQLWGILVIGSGAMLLFAGIFVYIRYLRVRPKSVLIVDDDQDIIDVVDGLLKIEGYTTRTATSGGECLKQLASAVPDLILLDIGMEPMDGWETIREIKKNTATRGIPVIMLTALRLTPKDVENYAICIEDYVLKPVTREGLVDAITHVFGRRQMIEEKIAAAKRAGIDRDKLCEHARLTRVVDVNKRLWDLLVRTYHLDTDTPEPESEIGIAIKNAERKIRDQEHRLKQIERSLGSGADQ
ncbi:response regulator receiver protein [Methanoregula boonei 6A8]|jgi:CheY-like chemotaxis protein|uniref:Response regulator receiver protein n=1 Tax=Methanoregula boonei (strain DSM 21154 / JCM 14090 / 6A8) TaxID=456442 RepID=A7I8D5_METB6|nr:response regulator [Methanoregula boonei]ABS55996.1 response regulator receiver protein [Methanoregula boonei 6A8]